MIGSCAAFTFLYIKSQWFFVEPETSGTIACSVEMLCALWSQAFQLL
jgi:hypothetical protein